MYLDYFCLCTLLPSVVVTFVIVRYIAAFQWSACLNYMSHVIRLRYFSSSVNSFFKRACAAIQRAGLDVWFCGRTLPLLPSVYFHISCMRTAKALARLRGCAGSPEPLLVAYVISTIILFGSFMCRCVLFYDQKGPQLGIVYKRLVSWWMGADMYQCFYCGILIFSYHDIFWK